MKLKCSREPSSSDSTIEVLKVPCEWTRTLIALFTLTALLTTGCRPSAAIDEAINASQPPAETDTSKPILTLTKPDTESSILEPAAQFALPVAGVCSEINRVVTLKSTLGATTRTDTTICGANGRFFVELDLSVFGTGTITLTASITSASNGMSAAATVQIIKNLNGPTNASIAISEGAAYTRSQTVNLILGAVGATEMYVTNSPGCGSGGVWRTYAATLPDWTLPLANAANTVYAKFRDKNSVETDCVSASIVHDNIPSLTTILTPNRSYVAASTPVEWVVNFAGATRNIDLTPSDLIVSSTGSATCTWSVSGSGVGATATRTIRATHCSGDGEVGFSIKAGVAGDLAGNTNAATSSSAPVKVDNTPPSGLTITKPASGDLVGTGRLTKITWTPPIDLDFSETPISAHYSNDGGTTWNLITANAPNSGSMAWIVPNSAGDRYQIRVQASDLAGNISTFTTGNFTIGDDGPSDTVSIAFTQPITDPTNLDPALQLAFPVAGLCSDPGQTVTLTSSLDATTRTATAVCGTNSRFSTTLDLSVFGTGTISLLASLTKASKTATASTSTLVVKNFAGPSNPEITIAGGATYTRSLAVNLGLGAIGATEMYLTRTASCSSGGSWQSYATSLSGWTLLQPNSTNDIYVKFRDARGVESGCVSSSIVHDDTEPIITLAAPNVMTVNSAGSVEWVARFEGALQSLALTTAELNITATGSAACTWSVTGSGLGEIASRTVRATNCSGDGTIRFSIKPGIASDFAGNLNETSAASAVVTIDNTPPAGLTITKPESGDIFGVDRPTKVTWTQPTDALFSTTPITAFYSADGGSSWNLISSNVPNSGNLAWLVPGAIGNQYRIKINATDMAGNTSSATTGDFSVAENAPTDTVTIAFTQPATDPATLDPALQLALPVAGLCSEPNQTITLQTVSGSTTRTSTTVCETNSRFATTIDLSSFGIGTITLTASLSKAGSPAVTSTSTQIVKGFDGPTNPRISLASGAAYTSSISVDLLLGAINAAEMYLTNTDGCGSGGTWQAYATTRAGWTLAQANATNFVYVKYRDSRNAESACVSVSVIHDNVAPLVTILPPSQTHVNAAMPIEWTLNFTGATQNISLTQSDLDMSATGTAACAWSISGTGHGATATRKVTASNCTGDGTIGFSVKAGVALDYAGNSNSASASGATTIVDNKAPEGLSITAPTTGIWVAGGSSLTIRYSLPTDSNFGGAPLALDWSPDGGATWNLLASSVSLTGSHPGSFSWLVPTANSSTYQVRVRATDLAGNVSSVTSGSFVVNSNAPPAPTLSLVTSSPNASPQPTLAVSGLISGGGQVAIFSSPTCAITELRGQAAISDSTTDVQVTNALATDSNYVFYAQQTDPSGLVSPCSSSGVTYVFNRGPTPPTGVVARPGPASVTISWNAVAGALGYSVLRSTTLGGPYVTIMSGLTVTNFTDLTPLNGTTYYYVVRSFNTVSSSLNSLEVSAVPLPLPGAPTNLTASISNSVATLNWSAGTDANFYTIRRGTASGGPYVTIATNVTGLTFQDMTLPTFSTSYFYVVTAGNTSGTSPYSNQVSVTSGGWLGTTTLTALPGDQMVQLSWGSVSGASHYRIRRALTSGGPYTLVGESTTLAFSDTGLVNDTNYFYVVSATGGPESSMSTEVSVRPQARTVATPTNLSATSSSITLVWESNSTSNQFRVKRSTTSGGPYTTIATVTGTSHNDSGCSGTCFYVVSNVWGSNESANSSQIAVRPVSGPQPTVSPTTSSLVLSWSSISNATSYEVWRAEGFNTPRTIVQASVAATTWTDTNVVAGTNYSYHIVPLYSSNDSRGIPGARGTGAVVPSSLPKPTNFVAWMNSISDTTWYWDPIPNATQYLYEYSTTSASGPWVTWQTTTSHYVLRNGNWDSCAPCFLRVTARNGLVNSPPSDVITVDMANWSESGSLTANPGNNSVALTWTQNYSSFEIYRSENLVLTFPQRIASGVTGFTYTDAAAVNGTPYTYVVVGVKANGTRGKAWWSSAVTPLGSLNLPAPTLTWSGGTLYWNRTDPATGYIVSRSSTPGGPYTVVNSNATCCSLSVSNPNSAPWYYVVQGRYGSLPLSPLSNEVNPITSYNSLTLNASPGDREVYLNWNSISNATAYQISRATSAHGPFTVIVASQTATDYLDTGLTNGTPYFYLVTPWYGSVLDSTARFNSNTARAAIPSTVTAPATPTNLQAKFPSWTVACLEWSGSPELEFYEVRYGTTSGSYTTTSPAFGATQFCTNSSTAFYSSYSNFFLQVRARRGSQVSSWSTEYSLNHTGYSSGPNQLSLTANSNNVVLNWPSASWPSSPTSYEIYRGSRPWGPWTLLTTVGNVNTYTDSAVTSGTTYYYRVRNLMTSASTAGPWLFSGYGATPGTNSTPAILEHGATSTSGNHCFYLRNVTGATNYHLKGSTTSSTGPWTTLASSTTPWVCFTPSLSAGQTQFIATNATVSGVETAVSSPALSFTVNSGTFNIALDNRPIVTPGPSSVALSWNAVSGATSYTIQRVDLMDPAFASTSYYQVLASGITSTSYTDTSITPGMRYEYNIYPVFSSAQSYGELTTGTGWSNVLTLTARPGYSSVTGLNLGPMTVRLANTSRVQVYGAAQTPVWGGGTGQLCRARRATTAGGPYTTVSVTTCAPSNFSFFTGAGQQVTFPGIYIDSVNSLVSDTTYYYSFSRIVDGYVSAWTSDVVVRALGSTPSAPAVTPSTNQMALTWTAISGATAYEIGRTSSLGDNSPISLGTVTGTSFTDTTVLPGIPYAYQFRAHFSDGAVSNWSTSSSAQTLFTSPLETVPSPTLMITGFSGSDASRLVTLNILNNNAFSGSTSPSLVYRFFSATSEGGPYTLCNQSSGSTTTVSCAAPTDASRYFVAINVLSGVSSANSNTVRVSTSSTTIGTPYVSGWTSDSLSLKWGAVEGAVQYVIMRVNAAGISIPIATVSETSYTDTGLITGNAYWYRVCPILADGTSSCAATPNSAAPSPSPMSDLSPPFLVWALPGTSGSTSVQICFSQVGSASYSLLRSTASGAQTLPALTTTTTPGCLNTSVTALDVTNYFVVLSTVNGHSSAPSMEVAVLISSSANYPFQWVMQSSEPGRISLEWSAVTGATGYDLYRVESDGLGTKLIGSNLTATSMNDTSVVIGQRYQYHLYPRFGSAIGARSPSTNWLVPAPQSLEAPSVIQGYASSTTTVQLTWNQVGGATFYDIFRSQSSTGPFVFVSSVASTSNTFSNSSLASGQTYFYVIQARNTYTSSPNSPVLGVTTTTTFSSTPTAAADDGIVNLTWSATSIATGYQVWRQAFSSVSGSGLGDWTFLGTTTSTQWPDTSITSGISYRHCVIVVLTGGNTGARGCVNSLPLAARAFESVFELLEGGAQSLTTAQTLNRSLRSMDSSWFNSVATSSRFEIVATNTDTSTRSVTLSCSGGWTFSVSVPPSTTVPTRLSTSLSSLATPCQLQLPSTPVSGQLRVHSARMVIRSGLSGGRFNRASVEYPLISGGASLSPLIGDESAFVSSTSHTSYQQLPNTSTYYKERAALSDLNGARPWTLEVVAGTQAGAQGQVALYNRTTGQIVLDSEMTLPNSPVPTLVTVSFSDSAANFGDLNEYELRAMCTNSCSGTSSPVVIFRAGLRVALTNISKVQTYQRVSSGLTTNASSQLLTGYVRPFDATLYTNPVVFFQANASLISGAGSSVSLMSFGTSDSPTSGTPIPNATLSIPDSNLNRLRSPALNFVSENRFGVQIDNSNSTTRLIDGVLVINTQ
jgi:fibronectin type 3 domain-containing protein